MTKLELCGFLKLSRVSLTIDRLHLEKYGGIFREINIINNVRIRIDFVDKDCKLMNEGEFSIYFDFDSFDNMILEIENYTEKKIEYWKRYFTDPEIFNNESNDWNEKPNWELFFCDLNNNQVSLPHGFIRMQ